MSTSIHRRRFGTYSPSPASPSLQRFSELLQAFVSLAATRNDIHLRGSATPPPLGFAVRIQPHPLSAGAEMMLSLNGARLTRWGAGQAECIGETVEMDLDLSGSYRWECLVFPSAELLARTLLQRLDDVLLEGHR